MGERGVVHHFWEISSQVTIPPKTYTLSCSALSGPSSSKTLPFAYCNNYIKLGTASCHVKTQSILPGTLLACQNVEISQKCLASCHHVLIEPMGPDGICSLEGPAPNRPAARKSKLQLCKELAVWKGMCSHFYLKVSWCNWLIKDFVMGLPFTEKGVWTSEFQASARINQEATAKKINAF